MHNIYLIFTNQMKKLGLGSRIALSFMAAAVWLWIWISSGEGNNYEITNITPGDHTVVTWQYVTLARSWTIPEDDPLFRWYEYILSGYDVNYKKEWFTPDLNPNIDLEIPTGEYNLIIAMQDTQENLLTLEEVDFQFNSTKHYGDLEISFPTEWAEIISWQPTTFTRSWYVNPASAFDSYRYIFQHGEIRDYHDTTDPFINFTAPTDTGNYTFHVLLYDDNENVMASWHINFRVIDSTNDPLRDIQNITPEDNATITWSTINFSWSWVILNDNAFSWYTYIISGTNNSYHTGGTKSEHNPNFNINLSDGHYELIIKMFAKDWYKLSEKEVNFTVVEASIPITWSVQITSGKNQTITSWNTTSFNWTWSITPNSAFSWFRYTLSGTDNNYKITEDTPETTTSYTSIALSSGNYVFTVSVISNGDQAIANDITNLTVTDNTPWSWEPESSSTTTWSVQITSEKNQTITSWNTASFNRTWSITPDSAFWFRYTLSGTDNNYKITEDTPETTTSYTSIALSSGNYVFTVSIISLPSQLSASPENEVIATDTWHVTVTYNTSWNWNGWGNEWNWTNTTDPNELKMEISSPGKNTIVETNDVLFSFEWTYPSWHVFYDYTYFIKRNSVNGPYIGTWPWTDTTGWLKEFTYHLPDGKYYFEAQIHTDNQWYPANASQWWWFLVFDDIYLDITSPTSWQCLTQTWVTFAWSWYAKNTFSGFEYSIVNNNGTYTKTWITTDTRLTLNDLKEWQYSFNVTLYYTWWRNTWDSINFCIKIPEPSSSLSVSSSPSWTITVNNATWTNVTIKWTGESVKFDSYSYVLLRNWSTYKAWTSSSINDYKKFENLPSGTYNFQIEMLTSTWVTIRSANTNFTIVIPTTLSINSPVTNSDSATLWWTWFAEDFHHYEYSLDRTDVAQNIASWTRNSYYTWFQISWLHHGNYKLTVNMKNSWWSTISGKSVIFEISDQLDISSSILSWDTIILQWNTLKSNSATFTWSGQSEDLSWFYYEISGTTFNNQTYLKTWIQTSWISWTTYKSWSWSISVSDLKTWIYRFTVKMLSWSTENTSFNEISKDFNVSIPAYIKITYPTEWTTITSSSAKFTWTGYSDVITRYEYKLSNYDTTNFCEDTYVNRNNLTNWNYTFTVWISSGWQLVAQDTVNFSVNIPTKSSWGWWSSSKSHPTNNLSLSIWNESPSANEWIQLIVKISDKYTWKVSFPKIQYYSWDTEKWIDIPVTSKNFVSDYSDDAKLWYVRFTSDDDWRKDLNQFIKFSKNWHYRIYAEDKDWFDTYVQIHVWAKKTVTNTWTTNSTWDVNSILREYIPEIFENTDTQEEVYIARSCKKYTIIYSDTLNIYTSPNLNISEFFINKDYLKRYLDSKNRYQSWCPTNIWWITTSYIDRTNSSSRYTAPNGKVWEEWNYYSNELNRELKTPTSFKTIAELKYYIRDRNPLINMATLWPVN